MMVFGLTKEDLSKPTIMNVREVSVHDGKGGWVEVSAGNHKVCLNERDKFLSQHLGGTGPYEITWTAQWRCGMGYLEVKSRTGETMGINASKLKIYDC